MATIGHLPQFDPETDSWSSFVERIQLFLEVNSVEAGKHAAVLLSALDGKTYALLRNLLAPQLPKEKSFKDLVDTLKRHFEPKPLIIAERFHFHRRCQGPGESVADFVAELRRLASTCEFGANLDEALRDRFVCGLHSEAIQKRLLTEADLQFARAADIALGLEAATKNVRQLQAPESSPTEVHRVVSTQGDTPPGCYRCGKPGHRATLCPMRSAICYHCGKRGHIRAVCHSAAKGQLPGKPLKDHRGQPQSQLSVQRVHPHPEETEDLEDTYLLHQIRGNPGQPLEVKVTLNGQPLWMELDTGAAVSLVSEQTYNSLLPSCVLQPSTAQLCTYSGELLPVIGKAGVEVQYGDQQACLPIFVVEGDGPSLFGRDWLARIRLDWHSINTVERGDLISVLDRHAELFEPGLGTLKGYKANISVEPGARPRFCKARPVPYALRGKVDEELVRLEKEGIIQPIQFADWAAPIVPVVKKDGQSVRICGDFKLTVNQASKLDRYPIPRIDDLFAQLAGGTSFSKLDMSQAYQQLELADEAKKYVVINTHRGLYAYNRLPFGVASAPGIFQRVMESLLSGLPGVVVYLDDILITGRTRAEHLKTLETVLQRLQDAGLKLRKDKCVFLASSVEYLGHRIDSQGLHPIVEKVEALQKAPEPQNVSELKSFLGLLTYYSKFLPNLSTVLAPLYQLLKVTERWQWTARQAQAFADAKKLLLTSQLLVHFDPSLEIRLACDASAYGIGAVLSHKMPDGSEKPVGFVSRTLTDAERNYSQIEKEGLACIFGVKKFHSYLFGHHFVLQTDHRPLLTLFNEAKAVPPQASGRIQRWALTLASYEYTIACRGTKEHANADAMSRLPLPEVPAQTPLPGELVLLVDGLEDAPITATQIAQWTKCDPVLSSVLQYIRLGWPNRVETELRAFWTRRLELTVHSDCIVWSGRVLVPPPGRENVLMELHGGHPGASRMKALARGLVWWPGIDQDIEHMVQQCTECQQARSVPPAAPLHPWVWPTRPWTRLHIDFAGPMEGKMFLVVIDAHSKWIEVLPVTSATALTTIQQLRQLFSRFGLPESIVSDNGPQFVAEEFQQFCQLNGIRHVRVAPYHPSSNGLAERAVQVFKQGFRKSVTGTVSDRIARFLFQYRLTPHSTTGVSPAELLMGRRLRSKLDLLQPSIHSRVLTRQHQQKEDHDRHSHARYLLGGKVWVQNFQSGERWLRGQLVKSKGPVSFEVQLEDGRLCHRHVDQLRQRFDEPVPDRAPSPTSRPVDGQIPEVGSSQLPVDTVEDSLNEADTEQPSMVETDTRVAGLSDGGVESRYPCRSRRPPERLTY